MVVTSVRKIRTTNSSEAGWGERGTSFKLKNDLAQEKDPRTTSEGKLERSPAAPLAKEKQVRSPAVPPLEGKQARCSQRLIR